MYRDASERISGVIMHIKANNFGVGTMSRNPLFSQIQVSYSKPNPDYRSYGNNNEVTLQNIQQPYSEI